MSVIHGYNIGSDKIPTLDLNFANKKSLTDSISNEIEVEFTRTQDTPSSYYKSDGIIGYAATDVPRFDHDPVTGESLGLLIEESRTNSITYSENFDTATTSWFNVNGGTGQVPVITPNAVVSPDGTTNATQIDFDVTGGSTGGDVSFIAQVYSANATDYTLSAWIKADSNFNLIFEQNTGSTTITPVTTEWQRITLTKLNDSGTRQIRIGLRADRPVPQTATIYIWGAQLEAGSFPTSYIPTPATFTSRASEATYYDQNGIVSTASTDVARDNAYFPDENGNFISAGLLLEGEGTNLVTYSEEFDNPAWSKASISVTANAITSPDGNLTADLLTSTVTGVTAINNSVTLPSAGTYNYSVYLKKGSHPLVALRTLNFDFNTTCYFDLENGVVGNAFNCSGEIEKLPNNWYKCNLIFSSQTDLTGLAYIYPATDDLDVVPESVSGQTFYAWGAQLEAGSYATSYIPTTVGISTRAADISSSSTSTRGADTANITGAGFSSFYNQSEGTVFASVRTVTPVSVANGFLRFTDGSVNNRIEIYQQNSGDPYPRVGGLYRYLNSTTATFFNQETGWNPDGKTIDNWAFAFNSSGFTFQTKFDATPSTGIGTYPQNLTQVSLGHRGTISRLTYWPKRLPDSDLQYLTK